MTNSIEAFAKNHQRDLIQSLIEVGSIKVIVDLTHSDLTIGWVRKIMDAAIHAMNDNDLEEIIVKTSGYSNHRDTIMKSYDFHRYGGQHIHYRLVNPKYEENRF